MIDDSGVTPVCCDEEMEELIPGTTDGAKEKHVPVYTESCSSISQDADSGNIKILTVKVGDLPHPMLPNHSIQWITVVTNEGVYRKSLHDCPNAQAEFLLRKDEAIKAIYAYCNLHGLWMTIPN